MDKATNFEPEVSFEHNERGEITQTVATPGYRHINRIMRAVVDEFVIDLINAPEGDDSQVLARHKMSKSAAVCYQRIVDRINLEMENFRVAVSNGTAPIDITAGVIDIGEPPSTFDDLEDEEGFQTLLEEEQE